MFDALQSKACLASAPVMQNMRCTLACCRGRSYMMMKKRMTSEHGIHLRKAGGVAWSSVIAMTSSIFIFMLCYCAEAP